MATSVSGFKNLAPTSSTKKAIKNVGTSAFMADIGTSPINDFGSIGLDEVKLNQTESRGQPQINSKTSSDRSSNLISFNSLRGSTISGKNFNKENMVGSGLLAPDSDQNTPDRFRIETTHVSTEECGASAASSHLSSATKSTPAAVATKER